MKRKNDDLLRLAFGELSAEAAQAAEAQAATDPAAQRELEAYRDLRAGLQHLPPPPPDGLSTERLRAAILDRELKTRRPSYAPLAWAPMALAAVAAVVFFARPAIQGEPTIVAESAVPSYKTYIKTPEFATPAPMAMSKSQPKKNIVPRPVDRVASTSTQDETEIRPAANRRRDRSSRTSRAIPRIAYGPGAKDEGDEKLPIYVLNPPPESIAPPSSVVSLDGGRVATNTDDTVVIISTQRDLETGAHAASETEAGSVLVGG